MLNIAFPRQHTAWYTYAVQYIYVQICSSLYSHVFFSCNSLTFVWYLHSLLLLFIPSFSSCVFLLERDYKRISQPVCCCTDTTRSKSGHLTERRPGGNIYREKTEGRDSERGPLFLFISFPLISLHWLLMHTLNSSAIYIYTKYYLYVHIKHTKKTVINQRMAIKHAVNTGKYYMLNFRSIQQRTTTWNYTAKQLDLIVLTVHELQR